MDKAYRIEDQKSNDAYGHDWFKTLPQAEAGDRLAKAWSVLRSHGFFPDYTQSADPERVIAFADLLDWEEG